MMLGTVKAGSANSAGPDDRLGHAPGAAHVGRSGRQAPSPNRPSARRPGTSRALRQDQRQQERAHADGEQHRAHRIERPRVGLGRRQQARQGKRDQRDRHAHPVDRGPAPQLDQHAAQERADRRRRATSPCRGPPGRACARSPETARWPAPACRRSPAPCRRPGPRAPTGRAASRARRRRRRSRRPRSAGRCGRSGDGRTGRPACRTPASASRRPARSR